MRWNWLSVIRIAVLAAAGCASHADRLRGVRQEFYAGQLERSLHSIEKRSKNKHDVDVFELDRAIVHLTAGRPRECEKLLREVRDRFEYLEQSSAGEVALAALTDDQRLAYAGEDYEKLMIRALLAIANLMTDGSDASAYALQVTAKQQEIMERGADETGENPKLGYRRLALGAYLYGLLREETHSNYDDAERAYMNVLEWAPGFRAAERDLERVRSGRHSEPGHGVLYVFTLVGRGPYKESVMELPTSAALLVADRIVSQSAGHSLPPTIAPIKVPRVVLTPNSIEAIQVACDGRPAGTTEPIADVGQLAVEQYAAIYPRVMGRAVARRVIKKGVVYAAKEVVRADNPLIELAFDAGGVVWEAAEAADTRCWGLLPNQVQVLRLELAAGKHRITLQGTGQFGSGPPSEAVVRIEPGRNTYLLANFPDSRLVGTIVTGPNPSVH